MLDVLPITRDSGQDATSIKLLRLLRLPRLWRIVRIVRLVKTARVLRDSKQMRKITEFFSLNAGVQGLIKIIMTVFLLNHITCCLWFLLAKLFDFSPDTWVARSDLVDADWSMQYIQSFYWSF